MKNLIIIIASILFELGCNNSIKDNSSEEKSKDSLSLESKNKVYQDSLSKKIYLLQGTWAENEKANTSFIIRKDLIYFFEHIDNPYKYEIVQDTLITFYGNIATKCNPS